VNACALTRRIYPARFGKIPLHRAALRGETRGGNPWSSCWSRASSAFYCISPSASARRTPRMRLCGIKWPRSRGSSEAVDPELIPSSVVDTTPHARHLYAGEHCGAPTADANLNGWSVESATPEISHSISFASLPPVSPKNSIRIHVHSGLIAPKRPCATAHMHGLVESPPSAPDLRPTASCVRNRGWPVP
jgi:hypothetical protein